MALTHIDKKGTIKMVDVSDKNKTPRRAVAYARVLMKPSTFKAITSGRIQKGNVLETARLAGIMAAKETHRLIPLCHPINITSIQIDIKPKKPNTIEIFTSVEGYDRTGVEMEALTASAICGLTIYDMAKAIDRSMKITEIKLLEKSGGRSGFYKRKN
ncbi:MAG: cyclic pyranopterin monophosphate synthase MoaC [Planctomycetota bacterium]|nr:cyclic pyranopterin monophosphate synthase MoaC [Planctomycetota bacterium]MDI6788402.1 cyclic pyranopterin monophosphate synthase MoaC [Planctomycetota bacterium]